MRDFKRRPVDGGDLFGIVVISWLLSFVSSAALDYNTKPTYVLHSNSCPSIAMVDSLRTEIKARDQMIDANFEIAADTIIRLSESDLKIARTMSILHGLQSPPTRFNPDDWQ